MTHDEALKMLKLDMAACTLTEDIITKAYRRAILDNHPDTAKGQPTVGMADLQQARQIVAGELAGRKNPCAQCKGHGRVPHKIGTRTCSACKGSGETT